jgi:hypothetical protein
MRNEVTLDLPTEPAALKDYSRSETLPNILAMIKLTNILEVARDRMSVSVTNKILISVRLTANL